jgi:hypothetical protein
MRDTFAYLTSFARFPRALRAFLREPLTLPRARAIVADRFAHRDRNFLRIVEQSIYNHPPSPYLKLLRHAGCELGDLKTLVAARGLDRALHALHDAGVYVTFEEFKGRTPIVRGRTTIAVSAQDFDNPCAQRDVTMTTGGTSGVATAVNHDLDHIASTAADAMLMFDAWNVLDSPAVFWQHILPGPGLRFVIQRARFGEPPEAWYSSRGWLDSRSWLKFDMATLYTLFWMRVFGAGPPLPRIARPADALVVVRHVRRLLDERGSCLVSTGTSGGARLAAAAERAGIRLDGATLRVGGEPITPAKAELLGRAGARVLPTYGAVETGAIGLGCPNGSASDHMHVASESVALITKPTWIEDAGATVDAFNLTSLVDASPKVMLNYQIDDYGTIEQRACGCPLHAAGFTSSLYGVGSYSKLLGESVTLLGSEVQAVLEDALPRRFGGTVLDYQLLEREDVRGFTRLYLIVSPRIPLSDDQEPGRVLLDAFRASGARGDAAGSIWEQAGTLQVLRQEPTATARGKQLPVHRERSAS